MTKFANFDQASLLKRRMAPPTLTSTPQPQIPERRHCDPPGLWVSVILGSVVIHLFAFWMLRLLLAGRLESWQLGKNLIPIEVVAAAPNTKSSIQLPQTPSSAAIRNPASANTRRTSNQRPSRQTSSTAISSSTRAASQQIRPQPPEVKRSPKELPASNSPQKQPTRPQTSSTKPNLPGNNSGQLGNSGISSTKSPTLPTGSSDQPNPPNPQQGGGFSVTIGNLDTDNTRDILHFDNGDQLATSKQTNTQLSNNELTQLGISLEQAVELKMVILINRTGEAIVYSPSIQVLRGNISQNTAKQLVRKLVAQWRFKPTVMEGQPVDRDYNLTLTISPSQK